MAKKPTNAQESLVYVLKLWSGELNGSTALNDKSDTKVPQTIRDLLKSKNVTQPSSSYYKWCAATVTAAFIKAGLWNLIQPYASVSTDTMHSVASNNGTLHPISDHGFKVGDIGWKKGHVGTIVKVSGNNFDTVDGNSGSGCHYCSYHTNNSSHFTHYISMNVDKVSGYTSPIYAIDPDNLTFEVKRDQGGFSIESAEWKNNALKIYSELKNGYGWTDIAVAGIIGNMHGESGLNPFAWNGGHVEDKGSSRAYGLCQWKSRYFKGASSYPDFDPYTSSSQGDPSDGVAQCQFINKEPESDSYIAGSKTKSYYRSMIKHFNSDIISQISALFDSGYTSLGEYRRADNLEVALCSWGAYFERGGAFQSSELDKRYKAAKRFISILDEVDHNDLDEWVLPDTVNNYFTYGASSENSEQVDDIVDYNQHYVKKLQKIANNNYNWPS